MYNESDNSPFKSILSLFIYPFEPESTYPEDSQGREHNPVLSESHCFCCNTLLNIIGFLWNCSKNNRQRKMSVFHLDTHSVLWRQTHLLFSLSQTRFMSPFQHCWWLAKIWWCLGGNFGIFPYILLILTLLVAVAAHLHDLLHDILTSLLVPASSPAHPLEENNIRDGGSASL